jgi:hypothetical protein
MMIPTSRSDRNRPESSGKITFSGRKAPEVDGQRKQYCGREDREIIPATSDRFLTVLSDLGTIHKRFIMIN